MIWPLIVTIFYFGCAMFAVRNGGKLACERMLSLSLLWSFLISNLAYWTLPLDFRIMVNALLDVVVFAAAATCAPVSRSRFHKGVMALAALSAATSCAFAYFRWLQPTLPEADASVAAAHYAGILNLIYFLECVTVGAWGMIDARRNADFHIVSRYSASPHAVSQRSGVRRKI